MSITSSDDLATLLSPLVPQDDFQITSPASGVLGQQHSDADLVSILRASCVV